MRPPPPGRGCSARPAAQGSGTPAVRQPSGGEGILLRPQQVEIGRQGGEGIGRIAQSGIHGQAAHPCPWVAHGGQGIQEPAWVVLERTAASSRCSRPRNAPHLGKRRVSCAPAAQKRQLTALGGRKIGVLPGGKGFPVERQDFRRNIGSSGISSAVLPERAQGAGTGKLRPLFRSGPARDRHPAGAGESAPEKPPVPE